MASRRRRLCCSQQHSVNASRNKDLCSESQLTAHCYCTKVSVCRAVQAERFGGAVCRNVVLKCRRGFNTVFSKTCRINIINFVYYRQKK